MRGHQRFSLWLLLLATCLSIVVGQGTSSSLPQSATTQPPPVTTTTALTTVPPASSSVIITSPPPTSPTTTNAPITSESTIPTRPTAATTNAQQSTPRSAQTTTTATNSQSPSPSPNLRVGSGTQPVTQTPIIIAAVVCGVIGLGLLIFCLTVAWNRGWRLRDRADPKDLMLDFNNPDTHANWRHSRTLNNIDADPSGYLVDNDGGAVVRKHSHNMHGTSGADVMRKPSYNPYPQPYSPPPSEGQITLPKIGTLPPQVSNTFAPKGNFGEYNWGANNRTSMMYNRDSRMYGGLQYHTTPTAPPPAAYSNYPYPPHQLYPHPEYPMENVPLHSEPYGSEVNSAITTSSVPLESAQNVREQQ